MVISADGYFYSYNIDLEHGGECALMKQYRFAHPYAAHGTALTKATVFWILGRNLL